VEHPSGRVTVIDINNGTDIDPKSARELAESFGAGARNIEINEMFGLKRMRALVEAGYDIELTNPIEYLDEILSGRSIFRYIQTHPDIDHMRGLTAIERKFSILNFWDTANEKEITEFQNDSDKEDWETYQRLRKSTEAPKTLVVNRGDRRPYFHSYEEDGDDIQILAPEPSLTAAANDTENHNNHSYVIRVRYGKVDVLLPGDAEDAVWESLVEEYRSDLSTAVLKASHHGRDSGYHEDAVRHISPEYTIVSVGKKPSTDASNKYRKHSGHVWSTRWKGNIILTVNPDGSATIDSEYDR
jgi:beta-lactamase superfamily II metal-dependent hydrolase